MKRSEIINTLSAAIKSIHSGIPGKPAVTIPGETIHAYMDDKDRLCVVIDAEQIVFIAEDILRKAGIE